MNIFEKVERNALFNGAGYIWNVFVSFFLTPYVVGRLGLQSFGIWAITGIVMGYFSLFDLAIHQPITKLIAELYSKFRAQGAKREENVETSRHGENVGHSTSVSQVSKDNVSAINGIINSGLLFALPLSIMLCGLGFVFTGCIANFFNFPQEIKPDAITAIKLAILTFGVMNILNIFPAILRGFQRMDIINKILIIISILNIVGTIFFLEKGYGLVGIMFNALIIVFIKGIIDICIVYKLYPALKINLFLVKRDSFLKIAKFGSIIRMHEVSGMISHSLDKLLIGHFLLIGNVGLFDIGQRFVVKVRTAIVSLSSVLMPAASELSASGDTENLLKMYIRSNKYLNLLIFPMSVYLFVIAPIFILAWIGPGYSMAAKTAQLLIIGFSVNFLSAVSYNVSIGIGKPEIPLKAGIIMLILNIVLSVPLIIKYGYFGTVLGTVLSLIIGTIAFFWFFYNFFKEGVVIFIKETLRVPLIASLLAGLTIYVILYYTKLYVYSASYPRMVNLGLFVLCGHIFGAIYFLVIWQTGYFKFEELQKYSKK